MGEWSLGEETKILEGTVPCFQHLWLAGGEKKKSERVECCDISVLFRKLICDVHT